MSEVKKYRADWRHVVETEFDDAQYVGIADFDAQRLRADTAEADLKRLDSLDTMQLIAELTKRNAAAEQRIADALQLLAETSKAILHHQANQPMSHRLEGLLTKARAKVDRYLKSAALNPNPEAESHEKY